MKTWINKLGSVLFASLLTLMLNGKAFAETDSVGEEPGVEIIEPAAEAGASTAAAESADAGTTTAGAESAAAGTSTAAGDAVDAGAAAVAVESKSIDQVSAADLPAADGIESPASDSAVPGSDSSSSTGSEPVESGESVSASAGETPSVSADLSDSAASPSPDCISGTDDAGSTEGGSDSAEQLSAPAAEASLQSDQGSAELPADLPDLPVSDQSESDSPLPADDSGLPAEDPSSENLPSAVSEEENPPAESDSSAVSDAEPAAELNPAEENQGSSAETTVSDELSETALSVQPAGGRSVTSDADGKNEPAEAAAPTDNPATKMPETPPTEDLPGSALPEKGQEAAALSNAEGTPAKTRKAVSSSAAAVQARSAAFSAGGTDQGEDSGKQSPDSNSNSNDETQDRTRSSADPDASPQGDNSLTQIDEGYYVLVNHSGSDALTADGDITVLAAGINRISSISGSGKVRIAGTGILLVDSLSGELELMTLTDIYDQGSVAVFVKQTDGSYLLNNGSVPAILDEEYEITDATLVLPDQSCLLLCGTGAEPMDDGSVSYYHGSDHQYHATNSNNVVESTGKLTIAERAALIIRRGASILLQNLETLGVSDDHDNYSRPKLSTKGNGTLVVDGIVDGGGFVEIADSSGALSGTGSITADKITVNDPKAIAGSEVTLSSQRLVLNGSGAAEDVKIHNSTFFPSNNSIQLTGLQSTGDCTLVLPDASVLRNIRVDGTLRLRQRVYQRNYNNDIIQTVGGSINGSGTVLFESGIFALEEGTSLNGVTISNEGGGIVYDYADITALSMNPLHIQPENASRADEKSGIVPVSAAALNEYNDHYSIKAIEVVSQIPLNDSTLTAEKSGGSYKLDLNSLKSIAETNMPKGEESYGEVSYNIVVELLRESSGGVFSSDFYQSDALTGTVPADDLCLVRICYMRNAEVTAPVGAATQTSTRFTGSGILGGSGAGSVNIGPANNGSNNGGSTDDNGGGNNGTNNGGNTDDNGGGNNGTNNGGNTGDNGGGNNGTNNGGNTGDNGGTNNGGNTDDNGGGNNGTNNGGNTDDNNGGNTGDNGGTNNGGNTDDNNGGNTGDNGGSNNGGNTDDNGGSNNGGNTDDNGGSNNGTNNGGNTGDNGGGKEDDNGGGNTDDNGGNNRDDEPSGDKDENTTPHFWTEPVQKSESPVYVLRASEEEKTRLERSGRAEVAVQYDLPAADSGKQLYVVFRNADGSVTAFRASYSLLSRILRFETDRLGEFVVVAFDFDGVEFSPDFYKALAQLEELGYLL